MSVQKRLRNDDDECTPENAKRQTTSNDISSSDALDLSSSSSCTFVEMSKSMVGAFGTRPLPLHEAFGDKAQFSHGDSRVKITTYTVSIKRCWSLVHAFDTSKLLRFTLTNMRFGINCSTVIETALANNTTIEKVSFVNVNTAGGTILPAILKGNKTLISLSVRHGNLIDGYNTFQQMASALHANSESKIERFEFKDLGLFACDTTSFFAAVATRPVRSMKFVGEKYTANKLISSIPVCPTLEKLTIRQEWYAKRECKDKNIEFSFLEGESFSNLSLYGVSLQDNDMVAFVASLAKNKTLKDLAITSSVTKIDSFPSLIDCLDAHHTLETLDLSTNCLTEESMVRLVTYLCREEAPLQHLALDNVDMTKGRFRLLADGISNLKTLSIQTAICDFDDFEYFLQKYKQTTVLLNVTHLNCPQRGVHMIELMEHKRLNEDNYDQRSTTLFDLMFDNSELRKHLELK